MADDKPVDAAWVLGFGAVLFAVLCLYLVFISNWYWACKAQIDRSTLAPVACGTGADSTTRLPPAPQPGATVPIEQQAWPNFGTGSGTYTSTARFWGDDIVSRFFAQVFALAGRVAEPFVAETVVPGWNRFMAPDDNRKALLGALSLVLVAVSKEWAKDVYRLLRRAKGDGPSR